MSKAAEMAARAAALAAPPEPKAAAPAPRMRPIKMTVDLTPDLRKILRDYPEEMKLPDATGKATIPGVEVIRAMIRVLEKDTGLREAVATEIRRAVEE